MGSGASAIDDTTLIISEVEQQKMKPLDGSDMDNFETAVLEVTKLRNFFHMLDIEGIKQSLGQISYNNGADMNEKPSKELTDAEKEIRGGAVVSVLLSKMAQRFDSLHETFLAIDTDRSGYLSKAEFQEVISDLVSSLSVA